MKTRRKFAGGLFRELGLLITNPKYADPIKLGHPFSDKYLSYRHEIFKIKYSDGKPEGIARLENVKERAMNDGELTNRERAKILQEIVVTRTVLAKYFFPWQRSGYSILFSDVRRNDILRAYNTKPIRTKVRRIVNKIISRKDKPTN